MRLARYSDVMRGGLLSFAAAALALTLGTTGRAQSPGAPQGGPITAGDYKHDKSPRLRDIPPKPYVGKKEHEANPNPRAVSQHKNQPDTTVQSTLAPSAMPDTDLNFEGIGFPGVSCNCAPPDTNGEVGETQYVQIVNEGYQVFDKNTGASVLGPISIETLWSGFGGVCEFNGDGDPVLLYDQLADRWVVSQFAGTSVPTDECIAVSTTSDATGSYNRYAFHLGSNFFDYPKLGVWPDAYYMSMNVFNSSGSTYLGPQPFAFNRAAMLAGTAATFVTTGITGGAGEEPYLPADLDGSALPPAGAPNTFVEWASAGNYKLFHFHPDFAIPANSTFTPVAGPQVAGFTELCATTRSCVPQAGTTSKLDALGDRLMFRAAYRNFGDHESVVINYTVSSNGVAGVRWVELRNVTNGPATVFQESTYQPDTTWRWMGSAAMDRNGNLAVGFSASSATIHPEIRYAGRLATDPLNTLAQGETTLFAGTGSQIGTYNRWGDYSALTVDPVDDCTFWYTNEYYVTTGSFNWHTRIGKFKFPQCAVEGGAGTLQGTVTNAATSAPIDGASVQIAGTTTSTNASGFYTTSLAGGTYAVTFSKAGYASKTVQNVQVTAGSTTTQDAALDPQPVLSITKTADNAVVNNGSQIGFTVTVTNTGIGAATALAIADTLPSGTDLNWSIDTSNSTNDWTLNGQSLARSAADLAPGTNTHVHVISTTTSQSCGTFNNSASYTSANGGSATSPQASVTVACARPFVTTSNQCSAYRGGTASPLSTLTYSVKGANLKSVSPNAFFYWVTVNAAVGSNTFVIPEAITTGNFSTLFQEGTSNVYSSACSSGGLSPSFTQTSTSGTTSSVTVKFTAPTAGIYYVGLQLKANNLVNKAAPKPTTTVHYTVKTNGVAGSDAAVDLVKQ